VVYPLVFFTCKISINFISGNYISGKKLVEIKTIVVYLLVFLLIKLSLILPVAIASAERILSMMKLFKKQLYNQIGNDWLNDCEL
jgi:hypothetical protein